VTRSIDITDPRVVKAYSHPLRIRILEFLEGRVASPREMATALDESLSNTAYHVRQLVGLGLVELVSETQRRGAVEHHYTAKLRPTFTDATWALLPTIVKRGMIGGRLYQGVSELIAAVEDGGFDGGDIHYTHTNGRLDGEAWKEVSGVLELALAEIDRIVAESEARLARGMGPGAAGERATVMMMHFRNPEAAGPTERPARLDEVRFRMRGVGSRAASEDGR
jgi:DNA-binding transcriptional ArsR family regulator